VIIKWTAQPQGTSRTPMITEDSRAWGLRPKSETAGQASTAPRQLIIEWITRL